MGKTWPAGGSPRRAGSRSRNWRPCPSPWCSRLLGGSRPWFFKGFERSCSRFCSPSGERLQDLPREGQVSGVPEGCERRPHPTLVDLDLSLEELDRPYLDKRLARQRLPRLPHLLRVRHEGAEVPAGSQRLPGGGDRGPRVRDVEQDAVDLALGNPLPDVPALHRDVPPGPGPPEVLLGERREVLADLVGDHPAARR